MENIRVGKEWCASVGGRGEVGRGLKGGGWGIGFKGEGGLQGKEHKEVCWLVCSWKRVYMNIHVYKPHELIIEETVKFM